MGGVEDGDAEVGDVEGEGEFECFQVDGVFGGGDKGVGLVLDGEAVEVREVGGGVTVMVAEDVFVDGGDAKGAELGKELVWAGDAAEGEGAFGNPTSPNRSEMWGTER